jgi:uncharacterized protein (TIGR02145 family)
LRQTHPAIVADAGTNYLLNGATHSFRVRSTTSWEIKKVEDPGGILDASYKTTLEAQTGGPNISPGNTLSFKVISTTSLTKNGVVTLTLADPADEAADVIVKIHGCNCGINGATVTVSGYKTHLYGNKCWMVENSRLGTSIAQSYPTQGTNGYYYTRANAGTACPSGWTIPTRDEITALASVINNTSSGIEKWWIGSAGVANNAFAGYYDDVDTPPQWKGWGSTGHYWGGTISDQTYYAGHSSMGLGIGTIPDRYYFSVRCLHN